jgi:hypothetical protein
MISLCCLCVFPPIFRLMISLCCLCVPLSLLGNGSSVRVSQFFVFYAVRVVSKESRRLISFSCNFLFALTMDKHFNEVYFRLYRSGDKKLKRRISITATYKTGLLSAANNSNVQAAMFFFWEHEALKVLSIFGKKTLISTDKQENSVPNIGSVTDASFEVSCRLSLRIAKHFWKSHTCCSATYVGALKCRWPFLFPIFLFAAQPKEYLSWTG